MIGSRVTKRYAKALFELAQQEGLLKQVENDLNTVFGVYEKSPEFRTLLQSPIIQAAEKKQVVIRFFKEKLQPVSFNFLLLLIKKGRENILPDAIHQFMDFLDEANGVLRGKVSAARALSDEQLAALKGKLDRISGKKVVLQQEVDANLLGGFVVRMQDTVIDVSLRSQLSRLKEHMVSAG